MTGYSLCRRSGIRLGAYCELFISFNLTKGQMEVRNPNVARLVDKRRHNPDADRIITAIPPVHGLSEAGESGKYAVNEK